MNEMLFFAHVLLILSFLWMAVRLKQHALTVYIALTGVLANLFVVKQTVLFGMQVTCSDVYMIGGILGLNLLQELYGKDAALKAVRASLLALLLFASMAQFHLLYEPSVFDRSHAAFDTILSATPRIVAASIGVYYLVQRLDIIIFGFLKNLLPHFGARMLFSLIISQAFDTALFSFFGLYGLVASLVDIMIVSFAIKCIIIACSSPIAALFKRIGSNEFSI